MDIGGTVTICPVVLFLELFLCPLNLIMVLKKFTHSKMMILNITKFITTTGYVQFTYQNE